MQYASERGDIQSFTMRLLTARVFLFFFLYSFFLFFSSCLFFKAAHHGTTRGREA